MVTRCAISAVASVFKAKHFLSDVPGNGPRCVRQHAQVVEMLLDRGALGAYVVTDRGHRAIAAG